MAEYNKTTEEYWLGKIGRPFSQASLPWGAAAATGKAQRVSQQRHLPAHMADTLKSLANHHETAIQLLLLGILKTVIFKYSHEQQVLVNLFNRDGMIPSAVPVEAGSSLKELITRLKDDYTGARNFALADPAALVQKYNIRYGQDIEAPFYRFAFLYDETPCATVCGQHAFVCAIHPHGSTYRVSFEYMAAGGFVAAFLELLMKNFLFVAGHIRQWLSLPVKDIDIRSAADLHITGTRESRPPFPQAQAGKTLHGIFEAHARSAPHRIAVVQGHHSISYGELNKKANQLARVLARNGVARHTIVGVLCSRNIEMIISLLAILKAGGAYMPIDPKYPEERKSYMLEDSGAGLLLTDQDDVVAGTARVIYLKTVDAEQEAAQDLSLHTDDAAAAYIIYTSGTTGKPKGVVVTHRNVLSLFFSQDYFRFDHTFTWSCFHSFCFDFSVWEMYGALLYGGRLVVLPESAVIDPAKVAAILQQEAVNVLCQTPTFFYNLMNEVLAAKEAPQLACIFFGGEALNLSRLKEWMRRYPATKLINMYGITETTIHTTYKEVTLADTELDISNIGRGLPHLDIHILNDALQEVPVGATGEIFVGGAGVARGYLNRVALTRQRFMPLQQYAAAGALYRSGDLARWLPNGEIEYIGRKDNQVKVNGFRIELEEIETQLLDTGMVNDAVVVLKEHNGAKCLCAYFVLSGKADAAMLREALKKRLPHYMVPAYFIPLEQLPLTINGKKNKALLPGIPANAGRVATPPQTARERALALAWARIFGVKDISTQDEFYERGGDSIRAIQLKAALTKQGYTIEIADILRLHTFRSIAANLQETRDVMDQGAVYGEMALNPVQARLLHMNAHALDHFNQSVLLDIQAPVSPDGIMSVFRELMRYHDALRMRLAAGDNNRYTAVIEEAAALPFTVYETPDHEGRQQFIQEKIAALQESFHIEEAPCMKLALFLSAAGRQLLICIHHLAIDGVSWRILLEDLNTLCRQLLEGAPLQLPPKTHSVKQWNARLQEAAAGSRVLRQLPYWKNVCRSSAAPAYKHEGKNYERDLSRITVTLESAHVQAMTTQAHHAYNTHTQDLLLAALYMAFAQQYAAPGLMLNLEHHGRGAEDFRDMNLDRTVGWFTSVFPCYVQAAAADDIREVVIAVKDTLRQVPGKGIGYGMLRYLSSLDPAEQAQLEYKPDIEFNFLGHLHAGADTGIFSINSYAAGKLRSPLYCHAAPVTINALVDAGGVLQAEILFNTSVLPPEEAAQLGSLFRERLVDVIRHCSQKQEREYTKTDFTCQELDRPKLNQLAAAFDIEDIYPLTPVQEGILFHHLLRADRKVYFEQVAYTYTAALDKDLLFESLDQLSQRHTLLRALFVHHEVARPVQLILRNGKVARRYEDITALAAGDQQQYIRQLREADRDKGFALEEGPLLRLCLLKMEEDRYCFIWSFHHLVMDGWCLDIVNTELFGIYRALSDKQAPHLLPAPAYRDFISWLSGRDMQASMQYWKNYLQGYTHRTRIPVLKGDNRQPPLFAIKADTLSAACEAGLRKLAADHQVTVNSLLQLAWGLLLSRYNNTEDVVFGLVVSGRPAEIKDIDRMIGMFINTIPQRMLFSGAADLIEMAGALQDRSIQSIAHQHYPLARLQKDTGQQGELFDHIMNYISYPMADRIQLFAGEGGSPNGQVGDVEVFEQTHYDFAVSIVDSGRITIKFDYNRNRYDHSIVEQLFAGWLHIIAQVAAGETKVSNIDAVTPACRHRLLEVFNAPAAPVAHRYAHQLFEEQVRKTPNKPALVSAGEELTYRALDERAAALCRELKAAGVEERTVVAIIADRSPATIIGILGILKAGCIYLPVEPDYPAPRISYMLGDAGASCIVCRKGTWEKLKQNGFEDSRWKGAGTQEDTGIFLHAGVSPQRRYEAGYAYILYTSGSTGQPKGVPIRHASVASFISWQQACLGITAQDHLLQFSSLCFDTSVEEIFLSLGSGARLVLCSKDILLDARQFISYANQHRVSVIHSVPSFIGTLEPDSLPHLRILITGGDTCPVSTAEKWCGKVRFYNSYGPTETTVTATQMLISGPSPYCYSLPVGKPVGAAQVLILDKQERLMPPGATGEIYIGGEGLSTGYINRPELTQACFVKHPLLAGSRLYRTGDLGRWLPDGTIEFLGRADRQVKIRGHRVELGEIEYHINQCCPLECVVLPVERTGNQSILVAYLQSDGPVDKTAIRSYLLERLPEYMVPAQFVTVHEIPLNYNGKVDVEALKLARESNARPPALASVHLTGTQQVLVKIWKEVLGVDTVGVDDNFFELGGTSIDMITVSSKLKTHFEMEDMLIKMFHHTTIHTLSAYIDNIRLNQPLAEHLQEMPLQAKTLLRERRQRKRDLRN